MTYKEALLVYIVAIVRLYVILLHLMLQNNKILLKGRLRFSIVPFNIKGIKVSIV